MTGTIRNIGREPIGEWEFIVGFGHAVYGAVTPDGDIIAFIGWWQSSYATRTQMAIIRALADDEYRGRPSFRDDHVVVTTQSSQVPDVLPPSLYEYANDRAAAAHGVAV